ncbi:histidine-phosphotransfer domain, HPT domain-containing protein [Clavulina sp. PMI_390]|nr:histidine-phosphotransfer domain, HPT domain-containing protein [Clavulina sp. PMI_390]
MTSTAVRTDNRTDKPRPPSSPPSRGANVDDATASAQRAARSPSPVARPSTPRRTSSSSKPPPASDDEPKKHSSSTSPSRIIERDSKSAAVEEAASSKPASTPVTEAPPSRPATESPSGRSRKPAKAAQIINMEIFGQILEMDDDDETHEFSKSIVWNFFDQASGTLIDIDQAIEKKDLKKISDLGHFLKGSSGALGIDQVQHSCEKMQHYGALRDEERGVDLTDAEALTMIVELHVTLKEQYAEAEAWLKKYFK